MSRSLAPAKSTVIFVILAVVGVAVGLPTRASGSDPDELIRRGVQLRKTDKDREALVLFQQAVEARRTPRGLAQLGLCEHALGMWIESEEHLTEALRHKDDAWIAKNAAALRSDLARIRETVGSIDVWGEPAGASVSIDGHAVATLPLASPIRALAGPHDLTVESTGFVSESRSLTVVAGRSSREHVALAAVPAARRAARATTPPPPEPVATPVPRVAPEALAARDPSGGGATESAPAAMITAPPPEKQAEPEATSSPVYTRWWFWTAIGVVVLGGAASVYLLTRPSSGCHAPAGEQCVTL